MRVVRFWNLNVFGHRSKKLGRPRHLGVSGKEASPKADFIEFGDTFGQGSTRKPGNLFSRAR